MEAKELNNLSVDEYLAIERETDSRYEYHDGRIYSMAGGTLNHGLIGGNIFGEIRTGLRSKGSTCRVINSEIKVHVKSKRCFLYPDTMVVCGEIKKSETEPNSLTNPKVIIEVLSKSTGNYDRGDKFYIYRQLPSFEEYILIEQNKPQIDIYRKEGDFWHLSRVEGLESELEIRAINLTIKLEEIYFDIVFPQDK